ncbi:OFA family MFS transporter [Candidatus Bipolaricaulota bacterium]|nr:OFA family MFS transporter [Candidatus Bipolaricaulota bacterium]
MAEVRVLGLPAESGRWGLVAVGFLANLCMGAVYAFSVFRTPLESLWGIGATASGLPYMVFLGVFGAGMALAGGIVDRWGPRKVGAFGGALVGGGWLLAGLSPNVGILTLLYGVIGGAGVGILYGCPIAVSTRWFPDRKGLAVGLTVMGFGLSTLVVAPLMRHLIKTAGVLPTFSILGGAFLVLLVLLALPLRYPPQGWRPAGWSPPASTSPGRADLDRRTMLRSPRFYVLWVVYAFGCLAGLMAIGITQPVGEQVAGLSPDLIAGVALPLFALCNAVGRPLFGSLTDRLTPRGTALLSFALIFIAAGAFRVWGEGSGPLFFVSFALLWLNLGAWLAIAPTATATFFGTTHYGKNYGLVFTAYGAGAILGMVLSGILRDATGTYLSVFPPVVALAGAGFLLALVGFSPARREGRR